METTEEEVKAKYAKLSKKLTEYAGGVDQFVDLRSIARRCGFKVTKLFRGKNYVSDSNSGRYEVWVEIPGWLEFKEGKGDSLGDAVKDAVLHLINNVYTLDD